MLILRINIDNILLRQGTRYRTVDLLPDDECTIEGDTALQKYIDRLINIDSQFQNPGFWDMLILRINIDNILLRQGMGYRTVDLLPDDECTIEGGTALQKTG